MSSSPKTVTFSNIRINNQHGGERITGCRLSAGNIMLVAFTKLLKDGNVAAVSVDRGCNVM